MKFRFWFLQLNLVSLLLLDVDTIFSYMESSFQASVLSDHKSRYCLWSLFITASLIGGLYFFGSAFLAKDFRVCAPLCTA